MDDKSVQVGSQQRIVTIDGYSIPLVWKGGFVRRHSSDPGEQTDRRTCSIGACSYVLVMLEVVNLARN